MTTKKIDGPWIKWHGGECPVPPRTEVEVKLRCGAVKGTRAGNSYWNHDKDYDTYDIVSYRTVTPPTKPITFEDVVPLTEIPPKGTEFWVISALANEGAYHFCGDDKEVVSQIVKRRMAYLEKEDALVAARHHFGLKGGEL